MKINVIPAVELSEDQLRAWSRLQAGDAGLANPFFRPEFTLAVAAARSDVRVAVWEQAGEPVGFLPFEHGGRRIGRPVGSCLNQFQGAIARGDVAWSPRDVVRAAGLREWWFDHLPVAQQAFAPHQYVVNDSPYLDLTQGFEHYRKSRGKSAATFVSHILQKHRKAERELGEVRLETSTTNRQALRQLLAWKIEQSHRTGVPCAFDLPWVVRLIERLLDDASESFSSSLMTLHIGDRMAAGFFGIRAGSVLQGSILGYDRDLGRFAPGLVLLMRIAQTADSLGVTRIDLGSGGDEYKGKLASGCDQVCEGAVPARPLLAPLYRGFFRTKDRLRATRLRRPVRRLRAWLLATRIRMGYTD